MERTNIFIIQDSITTSYQVNNNPYVALAKEIEAYLKSNLKKGFEVKLLEQLKDITTEYLNQTAAIIFLSQAMLYTAFTLKRDNKDYAQVKIILFLGKATENYTFNPDNKTFCIKKGWGGGLAKMIEIIKSD